MGNCREKIALRILRYGTENVSGIKRYGIVRSGNSLEIETFGPAAACKKVGAIVVTPYGDWGNYGTW